jgi:hypothetical protein
MAHPFAFGLASIIVALKLRRMVAQWEELIKQKITGEDPPPPLVVPSASPYPFCFCCQLSQPSSQVRACVLK